jgi:putative alpha-1,2-mannosidase
MSAWYVWSALGMYPMNPASGNYVLGSPVIEKATIKLPGNKLLEIKVNNQGAKNMFVEKATWNGKPLTNHAVAHSDLMQGGVLEITMKP